MSATLDHSPRLREILAAHSFLTDLKPRYRHIWEHCAAYHCFGQEEEIFQRGEFAEEIYIVHGGVVALETFVPREGTTTIQKVHPGQTFGWCALIPPYQWQFDARALEPVELAGFNAAALKAQAEEDHEFGYELYSRGMRLMSENLQGVYSKLLEFYCRE